MRGVEKATKEAYLTYDAFGAEAPQQSSSLIL